MPAGLSVAGSHRAAHAETLSARGGRLRCSGPALTHVVDRIRAIARAAGGGEQQGQSGKGLAQGALYASGHKGGLDRPGGRWIAVQQNVREQDPPSRSRGEGDGPAVRMH